MPSAGAQWSARPTAVHCTNPIWNPKGCQEGSIPTHLLYSAFGKSTQPHLWHLAGKHRGSTHSYLHLVYLLVPATGMVSSFPNSFVGNFPGKEKQDGSAEAMPALPERPGASFSRDWNSDHCQREPGARSWCPVGGRPIKGADCESSKGNITVSFFLALYKHPLILKLRLIFFSWY